MIYNSLEAYVADREYQAYMQGLNQEPKYTPVPNGYKICGVCELKVCRMDHPMCYDCRHKIDPIKYPYTNFRASTDESSLADASLSKGGGGGDRQDMTPDSDKQVPAPTDPRFNEELVNDHD